MTRRFRFDDRTVTELSKILGHEVFQAAREELETAASIIAMSRLERSETLKEKRALSRLPRLLADVIKTVEQINWLDRENIGLDRAILVPLLGPGLSLTLDDLRRLAANAGEHATKSRPKRSQVGNRSELAAVAVAVALERAGLYLGTSEGSKFGRVLNLVLHAGDPGRTGSDVRHLQKSALSLRKLIGGFFQTKRRRDP